MKYILLLLIGFYQKCISPLFPRCCRYYPTCSQYTRTAIERFGTVRGGLLGISRLLRCHPWARGGIDQVPAYFAWKYVFPNLSRLIQKNNFLHSVECFLSRRIAKISKKNNKE